MLRAGFQPHASTPFSLLTWKGSGSGIAKFILSGYIFSLCCYQSVPWDGFGLDDQKPFVVCQPGHGVIMVRHKKHAQHLRTCCTFRTGSLPSPWSSTLTLETHMRNLSQWECLLVLLLCLCRQKIWGWWRAAPTVIVFGQDLPILPAEAQLHVWDYHWSHAGICLLMIISQNIFVPVKPWENVLQEMYREQLRTAVVECPRQSFPVRFCEGILNSSCCFALLVHFAVSWKWLEQQEVVLLPGRLCRSFSKELEVHEDLFPVVFTVTI